LAAQSVAIGVIMAKARKADEEELEEELEDGEEQEAEKPKGKLLSWLKPPSFAMASRKMMIIAAASLLVLGGGGAYFYFFSSSEHEGPAKHAAKPVKPATFVDLPDVLVNLSSAANERTQYLKVKIVLEVPTPEVVTEIQPLMPRVLDTFQTYLRELRPSDLDGSAGLYRLKEELTRRVNAAVAPNRVTAVLFKEIIVQ
jgi:flagellar FliL protein